RRSTTRTPGGTCPRRPSLGGPAPPDPAPDSRNTRTPSREGRRSTLSATRDAGAARDRHAERARWSCDNPAVGRRDQFEDAAASVAGFYESWVIYLGIELGLFAAIRDAGRAGIAAE